MRIGIVGPAERTLAWENHLRPHQSVSEVVIAATLEDIGEVDACLLLDDSENKLDHVLNAVKAGFHSFLISKLPTDKSLVEKVYHASEEANVRVQFSHWPTLAPASQWMTQQVKNPSFIQLIRNISHTNFLENNIRFNDLWNDELAYCLKYMRGTVHHIDANTSALQSGKPHAIHITLRFDSGATAAIFISTCAQESSHNRLVSDRSLILNCDVEKQTVRVGRETQNGHFFFDKKTFDPALAAEQSVTQFLKSIQLRKPSLYNSYDLLRLTDTANQIQARL